MNVLKNTALILFSILGMVIFSHGQVTSSLYNLDFSIDYLSGGKIDFSTFKGKKVLFVNVASKCGYTPQYAELQKLADKYQDKLIVIGLPCNQFGGQEPGTSEEIATFCKVNYGVQFIITQKIDVKGNNQHELYKWLTNKSQNGKLDTSVQWNFQKYLIDEDGKLMASFSSSTTPLSSEILDLL